MMKKRTKPLELRQLETLLRRLPTNHPQFPIIKREAAKLYQGYIGEKKVDRQLKQLAKNYAIIPDIYLKTSDGTGFQIDSLLISNQALFIIETKNFNGKITFDTIHNQFTRKNGELEEGFRYPITQAEMTRMKFADWLHQQNIHSIPIYYFIAISDPSTIIDVIGDDKAIAEVVAHAEYIPQMIMKQEKNIKLQNNPQSNWNRHAIAERILQTCGEFKVDILQKFNIHPSVLKTGVICPYCNQFIMKRIHSGWYCGKCKSKSQHAHLQTIDDYFLLNNDYITNRICREILHIQSRTVVTNLLKKSLDYNKKKRHWILKESHTN